MTLGRQRPPRETPEVAKGVGRMIRAVGRRVGAEDPVDLAELQRLREALDEAEVLAVTGLRSGGYSWTEIADGLGVTRQSAHTRFTRKGIR